jgi:Cyanobacterial TRADD-N associated 2-Transmembrane domain
MEDPFVFVDTREITTSAADPSKIIATTSDPIKSGTRYEAQGDDDEREILEALLKKGTRQMFPRDMRRLRAYGAALAGGFAILPFFALVMMVAFYLTFSGQPNWVPMTLGLGVTCVLWLILSTPMSFLTAPDKVNTHSYGLLVSRLSQLETRLLVLQTQKQKLNLYQRIALEEAFTNFQELDAMLYESTARLPWVLGLGYVVAWFKIHRAEEALMEVEPIEMVVREAYHDQMAISSSSMKSRRELLDRLQLAMEILDPSMAQVFSTGSKSMDIPKEREDTKQETSDKQAPVAESIEKEANSRLTLREIRRTLNEFRDLLWEGLIRARNRLVGAIFAISFATYLLLCLTILSFSPAYSDFSSGRSVILTTATVYIIGAITGLFGRIYRESTVITAIDDYGLSIIRIIITFLLSGLASVGGVLITAILYGTISGEPTIYSLQGISELQELLYLLVAIISGLTSNLISGRIWKTADYYMSALVNSKALGSKTSDKYIEDKSTSTEPLEQRLEEIHKYEAKKARRWLGIGVVAVALGFLIILGGVAILFTRNTLLGVVIMALGILPEIIGFLAFQQNVKASRLLEQRQQRVQENTGMKLSTSSLNTQEKKTGVESSASSTRSSKP